MLKSSRVKDKLAKKEPIATDNGEGLLKHGKRAATDNGEGLLKHGKCKAKNNDFNPETNKAAFASLKLG
jgi:hypothetical protein